MCVKAFIFNQNRRRFKNWYTESTKIIFMVINGNKVSLIESLKIMSLKKFYIFILMEML